MRILKKIPIHPTFFLLFIWFIITGKTVEFLTFFLVLMIHEWGHYLVAKRAGYKLDSFYLAPYGVSLNYNQNFLSSKDEIKVALAGPLFNILSAVAITSIWWAFPVVYNYTNEIVTQSFLLALFNLLPAFPLDGGRVFINLFGDNVSRSKMLKISIINNFALSFVFLVLFVISCLYDCNITLALGCFFLLSGGIQTKKEGRYEMMYKFNKRVKNFSKVRLVFVKSETTISEILKKIERNHFSIFYVVDKNNKGRYIPEKIILDNLSNLDINKPIKEFIKK